MLTDAHCHPADLAGLFPGAEHERRLLGAICAASATSLEEFAFCESLALRAKAEGAPPILPGFAAHPQMPLRRPGFNAARSVETLEELAGSGRLALIGETGFDLYDTAFRETEAAQDALFRAHLDAALALGLPLVIHLRRAMHKIFAHTKALSKCRAVIFHAWPGTLGEGQALLRRGINAYFSFGASVVLGRKESARSCALLPAERILSETDAPFIPPRKGEFSRPADLPATLKAIAALRAVSEKGLESLIESNFRAAFLGEPS
ncbi:MAG: TatD family hydrolase [Treponema sp.]|nr:TatD family hydrolase [Treponema sp.]